MAQKKITDLNLRSDFDETCNLPADDTAQTWRVTGAQMLAYFKSLIAPITTRGDIMTAGASGVAQRLALGAAGKVLRSDGTDALYDFPEPAIAAKTSGYTVAAGDNFLTGDSTSGIFTFTLPAAASGNSGKRYVFKKIDTSANLITVTDGTLSLTLSFENDWLEVYSNGSVWKLLRRQTLAAQSDVRCDNHAGYGSTNTKVPYYTNATLVGTDMSITTNNATSGLQITINKAGIYTGVAMTNTVVSFGEGLGFTIGGTKTDGVLQIAVANVLARAYNCGVSGDASVVCCSFPGMYLPAGTVITPHTQLASAPNTASLSQLRIARIG